MGGLPSPEVGSVHSEQKRRLRLAFLGIALDHAAGVTDALQAGPAGLLHHLSHLVEVATDVAAWKTKFRIRCDERPYSGSSNVWHY